MLSRDYLSPSRSPDRMKGGGPRKGKYEPTVLGNLSSTRPILASMRSSSVFNCSLLRIRCCLRRRRRRRRRWFRSRDCRRFSLRARRGGLFENGKREKLMPWSFKNSANLHSELSVGESSYRNLFIMLHCQPVACESRFPASWTIRKEKRK